jgi:hypothetical protein
MCNPACRQAGVQIELQTFRFSVILGILEVQIILNITIP